jgi:NADH:ubiquinone oxidoreductase subunit 6 (subunit J)
MKKIIMFLFFVLVSSVGLFALTQNETNVVNSIKGVHTYIVLVGCLVCLIAFVVGGIKSAASDQMGKVIMITAGIVFFLILLSKPIFNVIMDQAAKGNTTNTDVQNAFQ